jgi:UDP-glucose 4-epimerase
MFDCAKESLPAPINAAFKSGRRRPVRCSPADVRALRQRRGVEPMKVLVTGGASYIGSHTTLCLLERGHDVVVLDNLVNSSSESLRRVQRLTGKSVEFQSIDLLDALAVDAVPAQGGFDSVIHFAGLKAVGESVEKPLKYYQNNVVGTLNLLHSMEAAACGGWCSVRQPLFSVPQSTY